MNPETIERIREFRAWLRKFEREMYFQNVASCCNGISLPLCHALLEIEDNPDISISDLAEKLTLEKAHLEKLIASPDVDRKIPGENRRTTKLALTKDGEKACKNINWNNDTYFTEALSCLKEGEQADFMRHFMQITEKLARMRTKLSTC